MLYPTPNRYERVWNNVFIDRHKCKYISKTNLKFQPEISLISTDAARCSPGGVLLIPVFKGDWQFYRYNTLEKVYNIPTNSF